MKREMCEDIKNGIPMRQNRKYKNTNTERHKYTNTANDELLERPNMICIVLYWKFDLDPLVF